MRFLAISSVKDSQIGQKCYEVIFPHIPFYRYQDEYESYGSEISQGLISRISDKILPEVNEWQNRSLYEISGSTEKSALSGKASLFFPFL